MILRQSTAVDVLIGPFVDSTDGYTAETGLSPSVKVAKNGQALAAKSDATTPVHDADGYYNCEIDATDTNTIGTLTLSVAGSATALAVRHEFQVIEEAAYDALYAASAAGPLQSTVAGRTLDVTATGGAGIDWANVENPTTAVDLSATDIQLVDTVTTYTGNTPQTADHAAGIDRNADLIESQRPSHTWQGNIYYVSPNDGSDVGAGTRDDPYATIQAAHDDLVTDSNHDVIILLADDTGLTTHTVAAKTTISKRYCFVRGPGRDFLITRTGNGDTIEVTADGVELSGFQLSRPVAGTGKGLQLTDADFLKVRDVWFNETRDDGINILRGENCVIEDNYFTGTGQGASGDGVQIDGTSGTASRNIIRNNHMHGVLGDGIKIDGGTILDTVIQGNLIVGSTSSGINIGASSTDAFITDNRLGNNTTADITDGGTTTININNAAVPTAVENRTEMDSNSTQLTAIVADTGELQTDWTNGGRLDLIVDAIPTNTEMVAAFTEIKGATWSSATDTLEAIRDRGDAAWVTGAGGSPPHLLQSTTIATLASQTSFTLTAGSADNDAYNGAIVVVTDQSTATQKAVGTVSDYTGATLTVTLSADPGIFTMATGDDIDIMSALGSAGSAPTAAQIVDEWETQSQADPTGFHVNVLEVAGTAQTANDNGADVNAILADTGELQTDWANGGRLDVILDARAAQTTVDDIETDTADIQTTIGALQDISAADVNAQVVDVLKTDTIADLTNGAPPTTPTFEEAVMYLYSGLVHKIDVDAGFKEYYNNAGTLIWKKALSDDGTNYIEAESQAGT